MAEHDALAPGTRLGELEVLRILGVGGFGIVYLARDHSLERDVALKEYMPASLARRGDNAQITVRSASFADTYAIGLRSFVNEAKLLARFDHPSLVKVYRFWEGNGTAYMVMPYLQGNTLRDVRRTMSQPPSEAWIRTLLDRVLGALEVMHREEVYHRDIAPDNILITPQGLPILLDFGAARRVISDRTQTLTAILKPSYAPIEQYAEMTQMRQGPWTDLYALGAVVHFLLKGTPPLPATARLVQDETTPLEMAPALGVSPRLLSVIDWAMALKPQDRPQDVASLRAALEGRIDPPPPPPSRQGVTVPGRTSLLPVTGTGASSAYEATVQTGPGAAATHTDFPPTQVATAPAASASAPLPEPVPHSLLSAGPAKSKPRPTAEAPRETSPSRGRPLVAATVVVLLVGAAAAWWWRGAANPPSVPAIAAPSPVPITAEVPTSPATTAPAAGDSAARGAPTTPADPPAEQAIVRTKPAPAPVTTEPAATNTVVPPRVVAQPQPRPRRAAPAESPTPTQETAPATATAQEVPAAPPAAAPAPVYSPPAANPAAMPATRPQDLDDDPPNGQRSSLLTTARQACEQAGRASIIACMQIQCRRPRYQSDLECIRLNSSRRLGDPP